MKIKFAVLLALVSLGCDYRITLPNAPTGPSITNNNTNTNTNTVDISDLVNFVPTFPPTTDNPNQPPTSGTPLAIPPGSETVARNAANANAGYIASSCHNTKFIDAIVNALKANDSRWGYICNTSCSQLSGDTIAYRATNTSTGVWAVDVIGNHCGTGPSFTWNVVGYAADRQWAAMR